MKKFELTDISIDFFGIKLFRIKALRDIGSIEDGEFGGYIEKEDNLSHEGNAWVYGDALVYGNAEVCGNARVCGNAEVYGNAWVCGNAEVFGDALVYGDALVCGNAEVYGNAEVCDDARVYDDARVCGNAEVYGNAWVCGNALVYGNADYVTIKGIGSIFRLTTAFRTKNNGVSVCCGCFYGTLQEFEEKVKQTHGDTKYGNEYIAFISLIKIHFDV